MLFGVPDEIPDVTRSSGGKELYIGSAISAIGTSFGVTSILYRDHRKGPGGPSGGATCPGGHMGCRGCALAYMGQGHQPLEAHAPKGQEEGRVLSTYPMQTDCGSADTT